MSVAYICGPMRNRPKFNFPAFDEAEKRLLALGYQVFSPAAMDRALGFDPETECPDGEMADPLLEQIVRRDLEAIFKSDVIVLLPGFEKSVGATAEIAVAKWLRKSIRPYEVFL